jgi:hypothetical protein
MFKDRTLILYFILFFIGAFVLFYQASGLGWLGDSVNFLCAVCFLTGFFVFHLRHVFENAVLISVGYMAPLLLRNILKERNFSGDFLISAFTSLAMTFIFALLFASLGYATGFILRKLR